MKKRPNIIIFLMDCVKRDHLSCYGYPVNTTPNIDKIAKEGTIFKNMVSTSGWTLPTHCSLFTGVYPSRHGASKERLYLDDRYPTMAEILQREGYNTAGFSSVAYVSRETGLDRGFESFEESFREEGMRFKLDRYNLKYKIYRVLSFLCEATNHDIIPGKITNWKVKNWFRKKLDVSKPFFLFIHYIDAHKPYVFKKYYNQIFLKDKEKINKSREIANYGWPDFTLKNNEIDKDIVTSLYDSKIFSIDYCIKEIIDLVKMNGQYDDTILILTADHGEIVTGIFDHHFFITDEVLKIPLIIRYPMLFKAGASNEDLASTVDILPTLLDAVGMEDYKFMSHFQGKSLLRELKGERYVVAERGKMNDPWLERLPELKKVESHPPFDCIQRAIRTKQYKYIWTSDGKEELYDILRDEKETYNIINESVEIAMELKKKLFEIVGTEYAEDIEKSAEIEEKLKKALESLGYI